MTARSSGPDGGTLSQWLEDQGLAPEGPGSIADTARVRALLVDAARQGRALSYSELLAMLGHRFTRPKMRALCKTLDAIDIAGAAAGEPGLAVLVVRESDRLPGQGWWVGAAERFGYTGLWTGADAAALVRARQEAVFAFWSAKPPTQIKPRERGSSTAVGGGEGETAMAVKGAGGNPGAETNKGGDPGSGAKGKTTGGKGGGGRSGGSKSGGGGNSGGGSSGGAG